MSIELKARLGELREEQRRLAVAVSDLELALVQYERYARHVRPFLRSSPWLLSAAGDGEVYLYATERLDFGERGIVFVIASGVTFSYVEGLSSLVGQGVDVVRFALLEGLDIDRSFLGESIVATTSQLEMLLEIEQMLDEGEVR